MKLGFFEPSQTKMSTVVQSASVDMPYEWSKHPLLQERLHPEHPDDLEVIVHDGGPRITDRKPELMWVTIAGVRTISLWGESSIDQCSWRPSTRAR